VLKPYFARLLPKLPSRRVIAMKAIVAVAALALSTRVGATELTKENWDAQTAGKSVFVKFQAPW